MIHLCNARRGSTPVLESGGLLGGIPLSRHERGLFIIHDDIEPFERTLFHLVDIASD